MHRFMAPSASPNTIATRIGWSRSRGRHSATRITAANARRPNAAPAGPSSSKTLTANAAPTCGEMAARRTRPTARFRSLCGTAAPSAARRSTPFLDLSVRPPARRLVDPAGALVALLGPQRRGRAAALAQDRLGRRQQGAAGAAPPRTRVRVEEVDRARDRGHEADHARLVLRHQLAAPEE